MNELSSLVSSCKKKPYFDWTSSGPYIRRINNDAREDEMEENMQAVGSVLSNLKNMAQDMGNEISKQNKQLDKITNKVLVTLDFLDREGLDRFRRQTPFMLTFFS